MAYVADTASTFSVLPLKRLVARWNAAKQLTAASLADVGRCTGLTHLTLLSAWLERATPQQVADCVVRLSALVSLAIEYSNRRLCGAAAADGDATAASDYDGDCDGEQRAGWSALAQVVGRLPALRRCYFRRLPLGSAAALLGAATQLTKLGLASCGVDDSIVAGLCGSLRGLRQLDLYNSGVSDACLPAIAAALRQLTYLRLSRVGRGRGGGVTDAGVQQLHAALPGLKVVVEDVYEESEPEVDDE